MNILSKFISQRLREMNLSERELAKKCGVSHSYINQLVRGINPTTNKKTNPTIKTLEKLAYGLEISIETLQNITRGIAIEETTHTGHLLETIEKNVSREGIPVGSKADKIIPWEIWDQIKEANKMFSCLGVDPSTISDEHWSRLLEDINLVVKLHLERNTKQ